MVAPIFDLPSSETLDFISQSTSRNPEYYFRKVYLPSAIIRLSNGDNLLGEGDVHLAGTGLTGYYDARDYFHGSPEEDPTLASMQGFDGDLEEATEALARLQGEVAADSLRTGFIPNIAQVVGIKLDPSTVTNHQGCRYYTVNVANTSVSMVDPCSRMGLFRMLDKPINLHWLVEDIDPSLEVALKLRHVN